jgi:hypothetical protein
MEIHPGTRRRLGHNYNYQFGNLRLLGRRGGWSIQVNKRLDIDVPKEPDIELQSTRQERPAGRSQTPDNIYHTAHKPDNALPK